MVGAKSSGTQFGDTTYTKIFVGGLPWETQRDTMKHYFEQFGEILEAVVITEKTTGRSKGYGFVTFKDPESALRACQNPNPVIDGRIANCNLAVLGAQKDHPQVAGLMKKSRAYYSSRNIATSPFLHTSAYFHQHNNPQYAFPYSACGYPSSFYPQDSFTMNYYNGYGGHGQGQQSHYAIGSSPPGPGGAYYYYYYCPLYAEPQRGESESHRPTTTSIPKVMIQHPYPYYPCIPLGPHQNRSDSVGSLPLPTSVSTGTPTSASQNNISL